MNNKGQTIFVNLMFVVLFIVLGLAFAPPLIKVGISNMAQLSCSAPIDNYTRSVCTSLDFFSFFFVAVIFGIAGYYAGEIVR